MSQQTDTDEVREIIGTLIDASKKCILGKRYKIVLSAISGFHAMIVVSFIPKDKGKEIAVFEGEQLIKNIEELIKNIEKMCQKSE